MRRAIFGVVVGVAVGCQSAPPPPASCKPEAPIAIAIDARPRGGGAYDVIVRATPTAHVASVELGLVVPSHAIASETRAGFGATLAGETRVLRAMVHAADRRAATLSAFARVPHAGIVMAAAADVAIGDPPVAARIREYALPDGDRARELRP